MQTQNAVSGECVTCQSRQASFFTHYRDFLLSKETISAFFNGIFLLAGFIFSLAGSPQTAKWLYLASALVGGMPLFILAAKNVFLRHDITAGVMASVAMIAAIIVGEYSAAAIVVFMFAIGEWLENLTIARANNALKDLASSVPSTITVRREGKEMVIPIEQVVAGDIVLIRSGERIGVDGTILKGSGTLNQAAITGESMAVEKSIGDEVFAGTLNEIGAFEFEVSRIGDETTLGRIIHLVKDAQASQAPVQRMANKYARILVPVTFTIALGMYLITGDILRAITILVVVCPCALVLATPTAVVAAIGNAARNGLLIKTGAVMEQVGKVDIVAFDKTGTLTYGKPVVHSVISLNGISGEQILSYAAAVEQFSEHPIGQSIYSASREKNLILPQNVQNFSVLPGFGVTAQVENRQLLIGNRRLLVERGVAWTETPHKEVAALEDIGHAAIPVAIDSKMAGFIMLADSIREESTATIARLKQMGVEAVMITGDNQRTAARVAALIGIKEFYAEVLPQDKLQIITKLKSTGKKVAFVGDGINDAPALAKADIGIAMGLGGTDVAMETASITLMADELQNLPKLIELSRRTLKVIRQNVIFSMSINLISVLLGGFGLIGPVVGALVHEFSALPVLGNAARLIANPKNVVK